MIPQRVGEDKLFITTIESPFFLTCDALHRYECPRHIEKQKQSLVEAYRNSGLSGPASRAAWGELPDVCLLHEETPVGGCWSRFPAHLTRVYHIITKSLIPFPRTTSVPGSTFTIFNNNENHKIAQPYSKYPAVNKVIHITRGTNPRLFAAGLRIEVASRIAPPKDKTSVTKFSAAQLNKPSCQGAN